MIMLVFFSTHRMCWDSGWTYDKQKRPLGWYRTAERRWRLSGRGCRFTWRSTLERREDELRRTSRRNQARWPCTQPEVKVAFVTARWVGLRAISVFPKRVKSCLIHAIGERCDTSKKRDWCAMELLMGAIGRHKITLLAIKYREFLFPKFFIFDSQSCDIVFIYVSY